MLDFAQSSRCLKSVPEANHDVRIVISHMVETLSQQTRDKVEKVLSVSKNLKECEFLNEHLVQFMRTGEQLAAESLELLPKRNLDLRRRKIPAQISTVNLESHDPGTPPIKQILPCKPELFLSQHLQLAKELMATPCNFASMERPNFPSDLSVDVNKLMLGCIPSKNQYQLKLQLIIRRSNDHPLLAVMAFESSNSFKTEYCVKGVGTEMASQFGGLFCNGPEVDQILHMMVPPENPKAPKDSDPLKSSREFENNKDYQVLRIFNVGKDKHKADIVRCKEPMNPNKPRTKVVMRSGKSDFFLMGALSNDQMLILFVCKPTHDWYSRLTDSSKSIDLNMFGRQNKNWKITSFGFDESYPLLDDSKPFRVWILMYCKGNVQVASLSLEMGTKAAKPQEIPANQKTRAPEAQKTHNRSISTDHSSWRLECLYSHLNVYYRHLVVVDALGIIFLVGSRPILTAEGSLETELLVTLHDKKKPSEPKLFTLGGLGQFTPEEILKHVFVKGVETQGSPIEAYFVASRINSSKLIYIKVSQEKNESLDPTNDKDKQFFQTSLEMYEPKEVLEKPSKIRIRDIVVAPNSAFMGAASNSPSIVCIDDNWNVMRLPTQNIERR